MHKKSSLINTGRVAGGATGLLRHMGQPSVRMDIPSVLAALIEQVSRRAGVAGALTDHPPVRMDILSVLGALIERTPRRGGGVGLRAHGAERARLGLGTQDGGVYRENH